MKNNYTGRGKTQIENAVICPPCGESQGPKAAVLQCRNAETRGKWVKRKSLFNNPPSVLRTTSPAGGEGYRGFTLIELLVVVLIMGILTAVAVPQYQKAVAKARTAEAVAMLKSLVLAEEVYFLANGEYTPDISKLDIDVPANQITATHSNADPNQFNTYMYSCRVGSCAANICNTDAPLLEFFFANNQKPDDENLLDTRGIQVCIPYTWTGGCKQKSDMAERICKSMSRGKNPWLYEWTSGNKNYSTLYYQSN